MALHVKSVGNGSPASSYVSLRHTTIGNQKRLIRLSRAANDNQTPHIRGVIWLFIAAGISAAMTTIFAFML